MYPEIAENGGSSGITPMGFTDNKRQVQSK
jgi:hypothetical protein